MRYPGLYPLGPWTPLPLFLLQRYNFIFNYKQMDVKNLADELKNKAGEVENLMRRSFDCLK